MASVCVLRAKEAKPVAKSEAPLQEIGARPGEAWQGAASLGSSLHRLVRHFRKAWQIYVLLTPMIIWFLVFLCKSMYGLQIAYKDFSIFRGIAESPWVGLEHFETLFSNSQFIRAIKNTVIISAYALVFGFRVPITLALMSNEVLNAVYKRTAQTIVYLPHFISTVFIAGVNPSLYERAMVDGASRWQMMWKITIPSIMPTILIMLIIRIGNIMEVGFELTIQMNHARYPRYREDWPIEKEARADQYSPGRYDGRLEPSN